MKTTDVKKIVHKVEDLVERLREIHEELEEIYDNRSEEWQESEKGEKYQNDLYSVEEFADALENDAYEISSNLELDD